MIEKYRIAGTLKEFYKQLDLLSGKNNEILIWQNQNDGQRKKILATLDSYLIDSTQAYINLKISEKIQLDKQLEIFIYAQTDGILFKGYYESFVNNSLKISAHDKVLLREKRSEDRLNFHYTSVQVNIIYQQKLEFKAIRLKDISELGFGILCNEVKAKAFEVGADLALSSIGKVQLPMSLQGKIKHITSSKKVVGVKNDLFYIGVELDQPSKLVSKIFQQM